MDFIFVIFIGLISLAIYFIPSIIAISRSHPSLGIIIVLNLLGGWTGIAWIAALIWALINKPAPVQHIYHGAPVSHAPTTKTDELSRLAALLEKGHISPAEFVAQKHDILSR